MEIIKKITFLVILTMGSISCNKSNTVTPIDTVIGTWKLSNIQGNITTMVGTNADVFVTSYNNIDKTKSQKMNNDAAEVYPYTLLLDIKAPQLLSVTETRTQDNKSYNDTYAGTWSKYAADNTLMLMGFENTDFYGDFGSNKFVITSSTASSLVLSYSNMITSGTPSKTVKTVYTLTFSK